MIDYYEILEVSPNASPEVLRAAYHILLARYDIDDYAHPKETEHQVTALKLAFDVLSDPVKRQDYDRKLATFKHESVQKQLERNISKHNETRNDRTVSDRSSLLSRLKWKQWGWSVSIAAVAAILISMVQPDPQRAERGQLAAQLKAEKDRAKLEIEVVNQAAGQQTPKPINNTTNSGEAVNPSSLQPSPPGKAQ